MILKGEKVRLRQIRMSDAPRFVKWFSDPSVNKYVARRRLTMREERAWIRSLPKLQKKQKHFAIETNSGVHIGSTGLRLDYPDNHAELGIIIGDKNYWNSGYGTDAMKVLLKYGFDTLKLNRIELKVYSYNPRAVHVYEKIGFKHEGVLRERVLYGKKYYDDYIMSMLRREWLRKYLR